MSEGADILIVDDSSSIRKMVQFILQSKGYKTAVAFDGQDAMEKMAKNRFKLIVCDINMPRLDGFELLRRIRGDDDLAAIPVIILTTEDQEMDRQKARSLGANAYISKPFKPAELVIQVREELHEAA